MPTPEQKAGVTVRFLWSKDASRNPVLVEQVTNPKFKGDKKTAYFMAVEELDNPGVERRVGLSSSLYASLVRVTNNEEMRLEDIIGKVVTITANYWTSAPLAKRDKNRKCVKCLGKGCSFCTVTGTDEDAGRITGLQPPTVFDSTIRHDLMSAGVKSGGSVATEF